MSLGSPSRVTYLLPGLVAQIKTRLVPPSPVHQRIKDQPDHHSQYIAGKYHIRGNRKFFATK